MAVNNTKEKEKKTVKKETANKNSTRKDDGKGRIAEVGEINIDNNILDDETKNLVIKDLSAKAESKNRKTLTYTEISDRLGDAEIDKDQMEEIYDALVGKGIEVVFESEPDDLELMEIEDEDVDDPEVEAVIADNPGAKEIDL